jgi:hypothetical protein
MVLGTELERSGRGPFQILIPAFIWEANKMYKELQDGSLRADFPIRGIHNMNQEYQPLNRDFHCLRLNINIV